MTKEGFSPTFLKRQVARSRAQGRTNSLLRRLIYDVVVRSLQAHYGDNYSDRCLQASDGVRQLLQSLGINSGLVHGAACFSQVYAGPPVVVSWGGFWEKDHHVWLMTELNELVDITVSQLHLHRAGSRREIGRAHV